MTALLALLAIAATVEAGARAALGDLPFAALFLLTAIATGLHAGQGYATWARRRRGWS